LPKTLSKGVATVAAMVSGLAPGKLADTEMVGKSTWGKGATGNCRDNGATKGPCRAGGKQAGGP
jgi:hypothetical protein